MRASLFQSSSVLTILVAATCETAELVQARRLTGTTTLGVYCLPPVEMLSSKWPRPSRLCGQFWGVLGFNPPLSPTAFFEPFGSDT